MDDMVGCLHVLGTTPHAISEILLLLRPGLCSGCASFPMLGVAFAWGRGPGLWTWISIGLADLHLQRRGVQM